MRFSELPEMGEGKPPSENAPFSLTNTPGAQEVNTPYVVTLAQTFFLRKHFTFSPFKQEGEKAGVSENLSSVSGGGLAATCSHSVHITAPQ